jgi:hypothetical protein
MNGAPSTGSAGADVCELAERVLGVPVRAVFAPSQDGFSSCRKRGKTYGKVFDGRHCNAKGCDPYFFENRLKIGSLWSALRRGKGQV